jgi:hypothetical protein
METNSLEKNKINKELSTIEEYNIKTRVFTYFFYVLQKKYVNVFLCILFMFIESLQFISFAFSEPVK